MTKHLFIHKKREAQSIMRVLMILTVFVWPFFAHAETTSITNTISVSSNGNGSAHTSTKTIINGVTVEDNTTDVSGTYSSTITSNGVTTSVETTTGEAHGRDAELLMLLEKLKVLLQYYVSLLNTK